ncbi:MAG: LPS export ABC transporter periplasmic protein LptC [gamma proteobacterium symbiont of Ctena orbiculata]|nr:MAG: LPS export ABC transporter periplasmic protein LptC [gamma proteobacterium symbiont of Ctena orbiculata]PVV17768.1 MAG: LPS export ABC transporter periplasmic protein LptC [gamma proteobacterium symbiont of Ctena orbiculata]
MKRQLIGLFFILAALLSLGWWMNRLTQSEEVRQPRVKIYPDSYADGLVLQTYDDQGVLKQRLQSRGMEHFEQTGITKLKQPTLWHFDQQAPPLQMQAQDGLIKRSESTLHLPGRVVIDRPSSADLAPLHIITRDLTLHIDESFATTEAPVRIESENQWMTATGMQAWLKGPMRLKLLHEVRGYYEIQ